jgi:hypothetical protein
MRPEDFLSGVMQIIDALQLIELRLRLQYSAYLQQAIVQLIPSCVLPIQASTSSFRLPHRQFAAAQSSFISQRAAKPELLQHRLPSCIIGIQYNPAAAPYTSATMNGTHTSSLDSSSDFDSIPSCIEAFCTSPSASRPFLIPLTPLPSAG